MDAKDKLIVRQVALKAAIELVVASKVELAQLESVTDRIEQIILKGHN